MEGTSGQKKPRPPSPPPPPGTSGQKKPRPPSPPPPGTSGQKKPRPPSPPPPGTSGQKKHRPPSPPPPGTSGQKKPRPPSPPGTSGSKNSKNLLRPPSPPDPNNNPEQIFDDGRYFYPLRTVVFYPIAANVDWNMLENFITTFGKVSEVKRVFSGNLGCVIVVYSTAAGAYAAVYGMQALKESLQVADRLYLAVLWPLTEFVLADREVGCTSPQRSTVRQEKRVLVHLCRTVSVARLKNHLEIFGPTDSLQMISYRPDLPPRVQMKLFRKRYPSVMVTFKRPLDAVAFVACYFIVDLGAKLRISNSNNAKVEYISPLSTINVSVQSTPVFEFEILYRYMCMLHAGYLLNWNSPRMLFTFKNSFTDQGMLPAMRLVELGGDVATIIIATAMGNAPLQYFELDLYFLRKVNNGLTLPLRYITGKERWASYFMLHIEKQYYNNFTEFALRTRLRMMNQVFPKLHPKVFTRNEHNFAFRQPIKRVLNEVTSDWVKRLRCVLAYRAAQVGSGCNIYHQPYIKLIDPDIYCDPKREWRIPIVIHSHTLGV